MTSDNQPLFTSWKFLRDSILGIPRSLANVTQKSVSMRIFVRKKGMSHVSTDVHRFRKVRKEENLPVVKLLPGSNERLAFEKLLRSVPETWGRMYDVLALRNK